MSKEGLGGVSTETIGSGGAVEKPLQNDGVLDTEFTKALERDSSSDTELKKALKAEAEPQEKPEYKGGSYSEVKKDCDSSTREVHHMPADSASDVPREDGPAIEMDKEDHKKTASHGNSKEAREYRQKQKELIEQGKFREAFEMDVADIREKFGDKYDKAIAEAEKQVTKLEEEKEDA